MSEQRNYCIVVRQTFWPLRREKQVDTAGNSTWSLRLWRGWDFRFARQMELPFTDAPIWIPLLKWKGYRTTPRL